jgi:Cu-Zn family superoxide dismutase
VGDLGNVFTNENGHGNYDHWDKEVTLFGKYSIIGRACVLHRFTDDLGRGAGEETKKTGNAGQRIACGVIGLAS